MMFYDDSTENSSASTSDSDDEFDNDNIYGGPGNGNNDGDNDDTRSNASYGENLRVRNLFSLGGLISDDERDI